MKKFIWALVIILCFALCAGQLVACNNGGEGESQHSEQGGGEQGGDPSGDPGDDPSGTPAAKTFTVTFKQDGANDVVLVIEENSGVAASAIPALVPKTGYTAVWEPVDLSNVTANITVNAVYTAKDYTITLDYGSLKQAETVDVKFGETPVFPEHLDTDEYGRVEIEWKTPAGTVYKGAYSYDEDITLTASYFWYSGNN